MPPLDQLHQPRLAIPGLMLAAGAGRRFGAPKLLAPLAGRPLICHSLQAALESSLGKIVVVVAAGDEELEAAIDAHFPGARLRLAHNPDPSRGILSSFRVGLTALPPAFEAVMVLLADMPYLVPATIDALCVAYRRLARVGGQPRIVIPDCEGDRYHPRLFPRELLDDFFALAEVEPETGSRVYRQLGESVLRVRVGQPGQFRDIDVVEDLIGIWSVQSAEKERKEN